MPGKSTRSKDATQDNAQASSQDNKEPDTPVSPAQTGEASGFDFTKALTKALKDPGVIQGLETIMKPMISEIMKPMISDYVSETLKPFQNKIEDLEVDVQTVQEVVNEHKLKMSASSDSMLRRIRELERSAKSRNLRITGLLPAEPTQGDPESTIYHRYVTSMRKILNEAGIDGIDDTDFSDFIRINIPNQTGSNQVTLVKMVSESKRDRLYMQKSKLKNCSSKFYLNEDLTSHDSKTFKRVRKEVKEGSLHSCWTRGGQVWAKSTQEGKPFPVPE